MGALATWGAISGGAEAAKESFTERETEEREERKRTLDEAREERMLKLKQKYGQETQKRGFEHEKGMAKEERGIRRELEEYKLGQKGKQAEEQRQFEAVQTDKKLESAEKIAGMKADASGSTKKKKRWTSKIVKGASRVTAEGVIQEPDRVTIVDENSGQTYTQQGRRFIPQGTDPSRVRPAPRSADADLQADPGLADAYVEAYGYLPAEFFQSSK